VAMRQYDFSSTADEPREGVAELRQH